MNPEAGTRDNIFLIGYRCTGKTSVGKLLSRELGWPFIDTDMLVVSESGRSIKEIVEVHGWETFRKIEHGIVKKVCSLDRQVVATGGGVVLDDANVNLMKKSGKLIWLKAVPATIAKRMMQDRDTEIFRPSLTSKDSFSEIEDTLNERNPIYSRAMDLSVDTDERTTDDIADTITEKLKK